MHRRASTLADSAAVGKALQGDLVAQSHDEILKLHGGSACPAGSQPGYTCKDLADYSTIDLDEINNEVQIAFEAAPDFDRAWKDSEQSEVDLNWVGDAFVPYLSASRDEIRSFDTCSEGARPKITRPDINAKAHAHIQHRKRICNTLHLLAAQCIHERSLYQAAYSDLTSAHSRLARLESLCFKRGWDGEELHQLGGYIGQESVQRRGDSSGAPGDRDASSVRGSNTQPDTLINQQSAAHLAAALDTATREKDGLRLILADWIILTQHLSSRAVAAFARQVYNTTSESILAQTIVAYYTNSDSSFESPSSSNAYPSPSASPSPTSETTTKSATITRTKTTRKMQNPNFDPAQCKPLLSIAALDAIVRPDPADQDLMRRLFRLLSTKDLKGLAERCDG